MRRCPAAALAAAVVSLASVSAQQPVPPRFSTEASAVVLDVVVRDPRGRPVLRLTRADFDVFEAGRRQAITVFEGPAAQPADATRDTGAGGVTPPRPRGTAAAAPGVVALVFEQLGPAARPVAGKRRTG